MIIIDKSSTSVRLLFTLTERTTITDPFYLLVMHSQFTNKTYRVQLPENTSNYKSRFDEFFLNSDIFKEMEGGQYSYKVYESAEANLDEKTLGDPIESGMIDLIDPASDEFISLEFPESDDDFITIEL